MLFSLPDMQLAVQLVGKLDPRASISQLSLSRRQLNRAGSKLDDVIFSHHALITQAEQSISIYFLAQRPEIVPCLPRRYGESFVIILPEYLQYLVGLLDARHLRQSQ